MDVDQVKYMVKLINPHKKGRVSVREWLVNNKFTDVSIMKSDLAIEFSDFICDGEFSYGYIQPGHGVKGWQVSIVENKDLVMMYEVDK